MLDVTLDGDDRTAILKYDPITADAMRCHQRVMAIAGKEGD
jgi:hypothetical protein